MIFPSRRDLRLKLSLTILAIQVLGQTVLNFKVSIAQILVTMLVAAAIELVVTFRREHVLAWPASALQTGASVAFILRASGTRHGDYWSLRGIHFFVIAAVISLLAKYLVRRPNGKHVFNPSNVGIIAVLLVVGPRYVFSEHLWWGKLGIPVLLAWAVILVPGWRILRAVKMIPMALAWIGTFAAVIGVFALMHRSFYATWSVRPVTGMSYWLNIALAPEVIAFVFFMISDPQTAPKSPRSRLMYGVVGALASAILLLFQSTEFAIKVALLVSLTVGCALVPAMDALNRRLEARRERRHDPDVRVERRGRMRAMWAGVATAMRTPAIAAVIVIAVGASVDTAALLANKEVVLIERDLPASGPVAGAAIHNAHRQ